MPISSSPIPPQTIRGDDILRSRNHSVVARHLAALRRSGARFEDVSRAELQFERLCDPLDRLPPPEIPIRSTALICTESPLAEFEVDDRVSGAMPIVVP
jgi:hypothetical protein